MADGNAAIEVDNVRKVYGTRAVLDGVSLRIEPGSSWAIIGPSASGKTVLLKAILGLIPVDGGDVRIHGRSMTRAGEKARLDILARIGVLFQQNALFDSMHNWENVCFGPLQNGTLDRGTAHDRAVELLGQVGLAPNTADLYPADLSGGMQKRVGLARALAGEAPTLVLDNPAAGLDPVLSTGIERLIDAIAERRDATVLVVTSEMERFEERYDNLALIYDGKIRWAGPSREAVTTDEPHVRQMLAGSREGPIRMRVKG